MQFTTSGNKELKAKKEELVRVYTTFLSYYVYIVSDVMNKSHYKLTYTLLEIMFRQSESENLNLLTTSLFL